jgi:hypothetical protein
MRGPVTVADSPHSGGKIRTATNQNNPFTKFGDDLTRTSASKAERGRKQRADAAIGLATNGRDQEGAMKMATKSENNIAALAAMFPAAFSAETWQEHRPLKVGIGNDLVARGVLGKREVNAALKRYVDHARAQELPWVAAMAFLPASVGKAILGGCGQPASIVRRLASNRAHRSSSDVSELQSNNPLTISPQVAPSLGCHLSENSPHENSPRKFVQCSRPSEQEFDVPREEIEYLVPKITSSTHRHLNQGLNCTISPPTHQGPV